MLGWYVLLGFVAATVGMIVIGEVTRKRKH